MPSRVMDLVAPRLPLRVVVAEDSVLLREGIAELLGRFNYHVVAAVGRADEMVIAVAEHEPDIVITDVRMPPAHSDEGLQAAVSLRARYPRMAILVLSQYITTTYATELLSSRNAEFGGLGYLLKDRVSNVDEFMQAVQDIADGETIIDADVVKQLLSSTSAETSAIQQLLSRECDVRQYFH